MRSILALAFAALILAACGGGASAPSPVPSSTSQSYQATASVSFIIPSATTAQSLDRRPEYIDPATKSFTVAVDGAATPVYAVANACVASVCAATLPVAPGSHQFTVALYASADGSGTPLASGSVTTTILANQLNAIAIILSSRAITASGSTTFLGSAVTQTLTLTQLGSSVSFAASACTPIGAQQPVASGVTITSLGPINNSTQSFAVTSGSTAGTCQILFAGTVGASLVVPVGVTITTITISSRR